ncbi:hypothetical protein RvY_17101 [Ramazzottius varieornatus]|uniref:Uncharacterized protein n=1 Tax=Ramazzottius varieornatus TaxID=947166 RepID=A0A1D1W1T9_RAMVA|nr:hypothetical protein RvY_17101 [Ramazzottius varieornatus]
MYGRNSKEHTDGHSSKFLSADWRNACGRSIPANGAKWGPLGEVRDLGSASFGVYYRDDVNRFIGVVICKH